MMDEEINRLSQQVRSLKEQVEVLAAEVKAWRAWYEEEKDINVTDPLLYQAVINAWAATDAAKAMEEKQ